MLPRGLPRLSRRAWLAGAAILGALALILALQGLLRGPKEEQIIVARPSESPTTAPVIVQETPTPKPSETPAAAATLEPSARSLPYTRVETRAQLIELFWWMIETGANDVWLEKIDLSEDVVAEVSDKFSNYFDRYRFDAKTSEIIVAFKPGLAALLAIQQGSVERLSGNVRNLAIQAQAAVDKLVRPGMSDVEKELAIHDFIDEHCVYQQGKDDSHTADALGFYLYGRCQCAGYVDIFRLLGRLAGLEIEMVGGPTTRDTADSKGHAWNLIRLDGLWYVVDCTWDDGPVIEHTFFNLPPSAFGSSRSWDQTVCPKGEYAAVVDDHYYYANAKYMAANSDQVVTVAASQLDAGDSAYVYYTGAGSPGPAGSALAARYGTLRAEVLSEDLTLKLYKLSGK